MGHPKTCARCGKGFRALGREYACPDCKTRGSRPLKLSFRERQIASLVAAAKSNKEIAYELCLTYGTVKEYIFQIFRKLNVTNRTELAMRYRESEASADICTGTGGD